MKKDKKIQTKFNENIITTSNTDEMYGKYLVKPLFRVWTENFLDGDTGEVIPIERNEMIFEKGTYLEEDQLAVINFHLQAGDLSEVTVSDQKRVGVLSVGWHIQPWCVTVQLQRKHKYLLLARNILQALEIVEDYIELHCDTSFSITSAKEFKDHIFIFDDTVKLVEHNGVEKPENELEEEKAYVYLFYSIEATAIWGDDREESHRFLVYAKDVDDAKKIIEKHIREKIRKETIRDEFTVMQAAMAQQTLEINITSATKVNCSGVIGLEFTEAYNKPKEEE